jgi:hypothetical protein
MMDEVAFLFSLTFFSDKFFFVFLDFFLNSEF